MYRAESNGMVGRFTRLCLLTFEYLAGCFLNSAQNKVEYAEIKQLIAKLYQSNLGLLNSRRSKKVFKSCFFDFRQILPEAF